MKYKLIFLILIFFTSVISDVNAQGRGPRKKSSNTTRPSKKGKPNKNKDTYNPKGAEKIKKKPLSEMPSPPGMPLRKLSSADIAAIKKITNNHGLFKCFDCADDIVKELKKRGISGEIIDLSVPKLGKYTFIKSKVKGDFITDEGKHRGILVQGKVYDNIHKEGIEYNTWLDDFEAYTDIKVDRTNF